MEKFLIALGALLVSFGAVKLVLALIFRKKDDHHE